MIKKTNKNNNTGVLQTAATDREEFGKLDLNGEKHRRLEK